MHTTISLLIIRNPTHLYLIHPTHTPPYSPLLSSNPLIYSNSHTSTYSHLPTPPLIHIYTHPLIHSFSHPHPLIHPYSHYPAWTTRSPCPRPLIPCWKLTATSRNSRCSCPVASLGCWCATCASSCLAQSTWIPTSGNSFEVSAEQRPAGAHW